MQEAIILQENKEFDTLMSKTAYAADMSKHQKDGVFADNAEWAVDSDNVDIVRKPISSGFLASFLIDARGGALTAQRHNLMKIFIPPNAATGPTRLIVRRCRMNTAVPQLNDGDGLACRVLEMGPVGTKFNSPIVLELPHSASLVNREREIVVLRSDNGTAWKEHLTEATDQAVRDSLGEYFDSVTPFCELKSRRIHRVLTYDLPQYFALVSRIRQELILIGPQGGVLSSTVVPQVQAVFPQGALQKNIRVGLQAHPIDPELVTKLFGARVSVSPIVTIEPRRRKFHKPITLTIPLPRGTLMAKKQGGDSRTVADSSSLRLLCSITGGVAPAFWEDITGSSSLSVHKDCVSFTTTVSARLWLVDCPNRSEVTDLASKLYLESTSVPYMGQFAVFGRRQDPEEAMIRCLCLTDDTIDKTLECQEGFELLSTGPEVEVLQNHAYWIETAGNLVPISKGGEQLHVGMRAFEENRLNMVVRVKHLNESPNGKIAFMRDARTIAQTTGPNPQVPVSVLDVKLGDEVSPSGDGPSLSNQKSNQQLIETSKPDLAKSNLNLRQVADMVGPDWPKLSKELGTNTDRIRSAYQHDNNSAAFATLIDWKENVAKKPASGSDLSRALKRAGLGHVLRSSMENIQLVCDERDANAALKELQPEITNDIRQNKVPLTKFNDTSISKTSTPNAQEVKRPTTNVSDDEEPLTVHVAKGRQLQPQIGTSEDKKRATQDERKEVFAALEDDMISDAIMAPNESSSTNKGAEAVVEVFEAAVIKRKTESPDADDQVVEENMIQAERAPASNQGVPSSVSSQDSADTVKQVKITGEDEGRDIVIESKKETAVHKSAPLKDEPEDCLLDMPIICQSDAGRCGEHESTWGHAQTAEEAAMKPHHHHDHDHEEKHKGHDHKASPKKKDTKKEDKEEDVLDAFMPIICETDHSRCGDHESTWGHAQTAEEADSHHHHHSPHSDESGHGKSPSGAAARSKLMESVASKGEEKSKSSASQRKGENENIDHDAATLKDHEDSMLTPAGLVQEPMASSEPASASSQGKKKRKRNKKGSNR